MADFKSSLKSALFATPILHRSKGAGDYKYTEYFENIFVKNNKSDDGVRFGTSKYSISIKVGEKMLSDVSTCQSISGLSMSRAVNTYKSGGDDLVYQSAGAISYNDINIKFASTNSDRFLKWITEGTTRNAIVKATVIIKIYQKIGSVTPCWEMTLENAFPKSWSIPGLNPGSTDVMIESLSLTFSNVSMNYIK